MKLMDVLGLKPPFPKFVIDNVADYYFHHEKETWALNEFPMPRPPFDEMWIEYKLPRTTWSKTVGETRFVEHDDEDVQFGGFVEKGARPGQWVISGSFWGVPKHGTLEQIQKGAHYGEVISMCYSINEDETAVAQVGVNDKTWKRCNEDRDEVISRLYAFHPLLMAFSFCNCRNIEIVKVQASEKLQKARSKRGKPALQDHHVINILPFGKFFEKGSRVMRIVQDNGAKLALAIRRGSYARYGEKYGRGLLFGKYEGMFWRPAILKETEKEYQVRAETDTRLGNERKESRESISRRATTGGHTMSTRGRS